MVINWLVIILLVALSLPGILIATPRLINYLLKENSNEIKKRVSFFAILQTLIMVFLMSLAGNILSKSTKLGAPILGPLLNNQTTTLTVSSLLLPTLALTVMGLLFFLAIKNLVLIRYTDQQTLSTVHTIHQVIGLDGAMLYSGVTDEIIARWGLLNVIAFFGFLIMGGYSQNIVWLAIILSASLFALGKIPIYLAAGCKANRPFLYALLTLHGGQSILFGVIFWHYGLLMSILSHMLFQLGWWILDKPKQ